MNEIDAGLLAQIDQELAFADHMINGILETVYEMFDAGHGDEYCVSIVLTAFQNAMAIRDMEPLAKTSLGVMFARTFVRLAKAERRVRA